MAAHDLRHYDGVLAFGRVLRDAYLRQGWAARAWVWHEAADTRVFYPRPERPREGEIIWIGNWGDDERTAEIRAFLLEPVRALRLRGRVHGVRYPRAALAALSRAGLGYRGWIPDFDVPDAFSRFPVTVHVPSRSHGDALRGIPTIRPFEALACGIPLVSAPWEDSEGLFTPGEDFLVARSGAEMRRHLRALLHDASFADHVRSSGLATIMSRHTCGHRVDELLAIHKELSEPERGRAPARAVAHGARGAGVNGGHAANGQGARTRRVA
jgi:spore maturation protein CgeB